MNESFENQERLVVNDKTRSYISKFCGWMKFLSIYGIVALILCLILYIIMMGTMLELGGSRISFAIPLLMAAVCALMIYVLIRLNQGQKNLKEALKTNNENDLTEGLRHFNFVAIFSGVMCILSILYIVVMIIYAITTVKKAAEYKDNLKNEKELYIKDMEKSNQTAHFDKARNYNAQMAQHGSIPHYCYLIADFMRQDNENDSLTAEQLIQEAIMRSSNEQVASSLNDVAYIHLNQSEYRRALTLIDRAILIAPDVAYIHDTRGEILLRLNRTDEALQEWNEVLRLQPDFLKEYPQSELYAKLKKEGKI